MQAWSLLKHFSQPPSEYKACCRTCCSITTECRLVVSIALGDMPSSDEAEEQSPRLRQVCLLLCPTTSGNEPSPAEKRIFTVIQLTDKVEGLALWCLVHHLDKPYNKGFLRFERTDPAEERLTTTTLVTCVSKAAYSCFAAALLAARQQLEATPLGNTQERTSFKQVRSGGVSTASRVCKGSKLCQKVKSDKHPKH